MQNARQPRYDWAKYFPRMLELYNSGQSITQIHKAIQCPNFTPSQRAVYDRFRHEGYSTGHGRWSEIPFAGSPAAGEAECAVTYESSLHGSVLEDDIPGAESSAPIATDVEMEESNVSSTQMISNLSNGFVHDISYRPQSPSLSQREKLVEGNKMISNSSHLAEQGEHAELTLIEFVREEFVDGQRGSDILPQVDFRTYQTLESESQAPLHNPEQEQFIQNLQQFGYLDKPPSLHNGGGRTKIPSHWARDGPSRTSEFPRLKKLRSLFDIRHNASKARADQGPPTADDDSGYYSGRKTPSTKQWRDSLISQVELPPEFERPCRIDCRTLHQPQWPDVYKQIPPCAECRYSNTHNLASIGPHLRLQEFQDELCLQDTYKIKDIDAAGNSALHYAAASGASYAHLIALIDAGVPPGWLNTANQNFLHCLRPCIVGFDGWDLESEKFNLEKLLDRLDCLDRKILFQQDNDGQTVLHALASHITEPELRDKIFMMFSAIGRPPVILDRFGRSAKKVVAPTYKFPHGTVASSTFDTTSTSTLNLDLSDTSGFGENAFHTIAEAYNKPHSFNNNKDIILHTLAKLNTESGGIVQSKDIIQMLCHFVAEGVNLNWHNYDGHHPLSAFICYKYQRGNETGATLAEYIAVLLWKDGQYGEPNNINVDMLNGNGATALHEAAIRGEWEAVQTLIRAGANVNTRLCNVPRGTRGPSVFRRTITARNAIPAHDYVSHHRAQMLEKVISLLKQAGAVVDPTSLEERGRST